MDIFSKAARPNSAKNRISGAEIALFALTFAITPIVGAIVITRAPERAVSTSLSGLAWRCGLMAPICVWGVLFFVNYFLSLKMTLDAAGAKKRVKITAYVLFGIAAAFTVATMCFPFLHGDDDPEVVWQRTVHNKLAPVGFSVLLVQTVVVLLLSVLRNYKQFMVSAAMAALFLVSSIFFACEANDLSSSMRISAVAQVYVLCAMNACIAFEYILTTLFDPMQKS